MTKVKAIKVKLQLHGKSESDIHIKAFCQADKHKHFETDQTVELGHGALAARLADVPHFDTSFAASVDMACRCADGDGTHHLSMAESVDLTGMARDAWAQESIRREGHRLHLSICTHMK